jgi:hypothetical protein
MVTLSELEGYEGLHHNCSTSINRSHITFKVKGVFYYKKIFNRRYINFEKVSYSLGNTDRKY